MARARRDPPPKFFQRSEFRRLASMTFLMVILWMIITSSRGPDNRRLLVGRDGNRDQVVGNVNDDVGSSDEPDRVPAHATPAASVSSSPGQSAAQPVALAENGAAAAPSSAQQTGASTAAPAKKQSTSTSQPAFEPHYNMAPTPPVAPADQDAANPLKPPATKSAPTKPLPPATGPTDEDPDEAASAEEDVQYVDDDSPGIVRSEMPAYERMVRWVTGQSFDRLAARSKLRKLDYSQVVASSGDIRGKLFQFDMHIRRAMAYEKPMNFYDQNEDPHDPVMLYELWGDTGESRGRLFQLVVYDPPAGMPLGANISEDVRFVGYFFKLQGYEPAKAAPGAPLLKAPTFIGRVLWMERPPAVLVNKADLWWVAALGATLLLALIGWFAWLFVLRKTPPNVAQLSVDLSIPSAVSIDEWLDQPDRDRRDARRPNRSGDYDDDSDRAAYPGGAAGSDGADHGADHGTGNRAGYRSNSSTNGNGNGHAKLFSDQPDPEA